MRVALLGATGNLGAVLQERLVRDGHDVQALIHNQTPPPAKGATYIKGDALDYDDILKTIKSCTAVIDVVGGSEDSTIRSQVAALLVKAMQAQHIQRLIIMGGSGVLRVGPWKFSQMPVFPNNKRKVTKDHERVHLLLLHSDLDWTQVCPSIMTEGPAIGKYKIRVGHPFLLWKQKVRLEDVADCISKELTTNHYLHKQITLIN
jgi:putative NADH-flavin reductase